ncbi:MAG: hypothetical protein NPIRA05_00190 [Nitrospirales bacterium]|nr:MAG: hypothetical protein NPIRA05_00190 [Nitrospirales bacterium]
MKQSWSHITFSIFFCFLIFVPKVAAVSLSLDVDPSTAGIQSSRTVVIGNPVSVDVVVSDLTDTLQGFEFDVDYNPSVLTATSVVSGGFLPTPLVIENDVVPPDVNFAEVNLGVSTAMGNGVLTSMAFNTVGLGTSSLLLSDVILSGVTGPGNIFEITPVTFEDGSITVDDGGDVAPIPEPATVLLFGTGLAGLFWIRKFRK